MLLEARKPEASDSVEGLGPGEVDTQGEALSVKEGDAPGVGGATGSAESAFARAASASGAEELRAALAAAGREARRTVLSSLSPVHGRSLLHLAAASGDSDKTRALLSLGARVNAKVRAPSAPNGFLYGWLFLAIPVRPPHCTLRYTVFPPSNDGRAPAAVARFGIAVFVCQLFLGTPGALSGLSSPTRHRLGVGSTSPPTSCVNCWIPSLRPGQG